MDEQEMKIWEGLGVTPDDAPDEDPAEPAEETLEPEDEGAAEVGADPEKAGGTDDPEQEEPGGPEADAPDPEEAHRQELERVRREGAAALDQQIAKLNLCNPYDGNKPITTVAEYDAYQTAAREANVADICRKAGITREQFDELVAGDPGVKAARDAEARAVQAEKDAQARQARERLDAEIAEIGKLCPEVRDQATLVGHKSWPKVRERMRKTGCGVLDAFRLENFEELRRQSAEAGRRQSARNNRGKDHLRGTAGKGRGGASIPADQLKIYQQLNPGASLEELQAFHAANNKH